MAPENREAVRPFREDPVSSSSRKVALKPVAISGQPLLTALPYFGSGVTNSNMESCTQPLPSFLYHRMGMPVLRISGESCT